MIHAPLGKTDFTLAERTPPFSRNCRESPGWTKSGLKRHSSVVSKRQYVYYMRQPYAFDGMVNCMGSLLVEFGGLDLWRLLDRIKQIIVWNRDNRVLEASDQPSSHGERGGKYN
jgi:hypothetical protein